MNNLPSNTTLDRFVAVCRADERVVAAALHGSHARGAADPYSDLDLGVITTDAAYEGFVAGREAFVRQLGEPLFLEDFDLPDTLFFILADGTEGELVIGRESRFYETDGGPFRVLVDKAGILAGTVFSRAHPAPAERAETLRQLVVWFWHDLSHFITALGRGQLWWAAGQLEVLRRYGVNLARLRHDFTDSDVGEEAYFKVERALPAELLSPLATTFVPLERDALLRA
ncbi:aminoglycoside 6-adenylyltransferase, partial [Promineifilum sp.]|uniref:aminoglycoside 6-adenylyltransferase n=1 Tax=Promineifilum sp. TaxID=2664178 RepID=UPI0035B1BB97